MLVSDHPHAQLLQRLYGTYGEGGFDNALKLMEELVEEPFVLHCAGTSPVAGDFFGLDGMKAHIADFGRLSEGTFGLTQLGFYADDNWGLVSQIVTASRKGHSLEMAGAGFWRFGKPGRLVEHWEVASDVGAWDSFWNA